MIELRTGVPGSGKTLSMVQALAGLQKAWEKKPEELRLVFVHNIKGLALTHLPLPTKEIQVGQKKQLVPDWGLVPDGSIIIIDECQDLFPPRSSQSTAPDHVAFLNTHRHHGFDLWITTQHPKLIDFSVRALVGKHQHYRRLFGGQRAVCYEFDACSDNLGGIKDAIKSYFSFPKDAYKFYKSAEVHTKQKFRLPAWLLVPLLGVALGVYAIPASYHVLGNAMTGKGISSKAVPDAAAPGVALATPNSAAASAPRPAGLPPAPAAPMPLLAASRVAGCVKLRDRCECFDVRGLKLEDVEDVCQDKMSESRPVVNVGPDTPTPASVLASNESDASVLAFMAQRSRVLPH